MKRNSNLVPYFVIILVIGVISSVVNGNIPLGAMIQNWQDYDIKTLLDTLNIGLGFLAMGSIVVYFILRAARGKEDNWLEQVLLDKEEKDQRDS